MAASIPLHIGPTGVKTALDALRGETGLAVIGVPTPHTENRAFARVAVRTAVQNLLAQFWLCSAHDIQFSSQPGQVVALQGAPGAMQISFSHTPGLSVAALRPQQKIGVDILRADSVREGGAAVPHRLLNNGSGLLSDWEHLALDYLGPAAHKRLKSSHEQERARLFAQCWSDQEAGLKCLGLGLQEWSPEIQRALNNCHLVPLSLPLAMAPLFCGSVALQAKGSHAPV